MNFEKTPSFYENNEQFIKYLGYTSFYKQLQSCVLKVIKIANPKTILELGFGNGYTTIRVAKIMKDALIQALDIREEMKKIAENNAQEDGVENVEFIVSDMVDYLKNVKELPDFTYALYSFHHIEDPLKNKIDFLKQCKEKMKKGSYLCIAETFLPEGSGEISRYVSTNEIYTKRSEEAYYSVCWEALSGLENDDVNNATKAGKYAFDFEYKAGQLVINRDNEYLVRLNWLKKEVEKIGFDITLILPINIIGDAVVLLRS